MKYVIGSILAYLVLQSMQSTGTAPVTTSRALPQGSYGGPNKQYTTNTDPTLQVVGTVASAAGDIAKMIAALYSSSGSDPRATGQNTGQVDGYWA